MKKAIFAGSFDPFHNGHMDVLLRASKLFDKIYVVVASNPSKTMNGCIPVDERVRLISECLDDYSSMPRGDDIVNFRVEKHGGLLCDYAGQHDVDFYIRGIRGASDLDFEQSFYLNNLFLGEQETIWFPCQPENKIISSSLIRELTFHPGTAELVQKYVPPIIWSYLKNEFYPNAE